VATWAKLNGGMIKMFEAEVTAAASSAPGRKASACWRALLCSAFAVERTPRHVTSRPLQVLLKFPVIQHFLFGGMLPPPHRAPQ
jgi:hypothetical protein